MSKKQILAVGLFVGWWLSFAFNTYVMGFCHWTVAP